jgi:hypothetical protein
MTEENNFIEVLVKIFKTNLCFSNTVLPYQHINNKI